jgi:hypothetical protein
VFETLRAADWSAVGAGVEGVKAHASAATASPDQLRVWETEGLAAVAAGKLAIVLLAGT